MRRTRPRLLTLLLVLLITAGLAAPAAIGAPGPRGRTSISSDRAACEVTATFIWKNVDVATVTGSASITLTPTSGSTFAARSVAVDSPSGSVSVTAPVSNYIGQGVTAGGFIPGAISVVWSRTLTVNCR